MKWAGYVERMGGERLAEKTNTPREGKGCEEDRDCDVKRDMETMGEEWRPRGV